jgi:hypothetical protein
LQDITAISVEHAPLRSGQRQNREFWFKLPAQVPASGSTAWFLPSFEEILGEPGTQTTWYRIVHGQPMPSNAIGANAPRMRLAVMTKKEFELKTRKEIRAFDVLRLDRLIRGEPYPDASFHLIASPPNLFPPC